MENSLTLISDSEKETKKIAQDLISRSWKVLSSYCLVLMLEGELGAGKTVFAKGVAEALKINKVIRSPSFIIIREFPYLYQNVEGTFFHIDLWRLESEGEIQKLKIKQLIKPKNLLLIEWSERISKKTKRLSLEKAVIVSIKIIQVGESRRIIEVKNSF